MRFLVLLLLALIIPKAPAYQEDTTVRFDKSAHDFGDFLVDAGPQTCVFTLTNVSEKPIVIQTVISSCGCTTPEWTKAPILPGKTGTINATFLNNQGPYPFDKTLSVYITGQSTPYLLHIRGVVHDKPFTLEQTHPIVMGPLRLRKKAVELGQIKQGMSKTDSVEIVNVSKLPVIIAIQKNDPNLIVKASPLKLNPKEKGQLIYTIDTRKKEDWGTVIYPFQLILNDKSNPLHTLTVKASIVMNNLYLTRADRDAAPVIQLDNNSFNFYTQKVGTTLKAIFKMTNKGKTPLTIYKTDYSHSNIEATIPQTIAPGEEVTINATIKQVQEKGDVIYTISLTTNSPSRPIVNLMMYGKFN